MRIHDDQQEVRIRRGRWVLLGDERTLHVRQLGKGMFTTAFVARGEPGEVYLVTTEGDGGDLSKRMLFELNNPNPYLPQLERVGFEEGNWQRVIYRMPRYTAPLTKRSSPGAWAEYRLLKACRDAVPVSPSLWAGRERREAILACLKSSGNVRLPLRRALGQLSRAAADFGSGEYDFEFSPRNLASDPAQPDQLILLDVLFSRESSRLKKR